MKKEYKFFIANSVTAVKLSVCHVVYPGLLAEESYCSLLNISSHVSSPPGWI